MVARKTARFTRFSMIVMSVLATTISLPISVAQEDVEVYGLDADCYGFWWTLTPAGPDQTTGVKQLVVNAQYIAVAVVLNVTSGPPPVWAYVQIQTAPPVCIPGEVVIHGPEGPIQIWPL